MRVGVGWDCSHCGLPIRQGSISIHRPWIEMELV